MQFNNFFQGGNNGVVIQGSTTHFGPRNHIVVVPTATGSNVKVQAGSNLIIAENYFDNVNSANGGLAAIGTTGTGAINRLRVLNNHFNMNSGNPAILLDNAAGISMNGPFVIAGNNIAGNTAPITPSIVRLSNLTAAALNNMVIAQNEASSVTTTYDKAGTTPAGTRPVLVTGNNVGGAQESRGNAVFSAVASVVVTHNLFAAPNWFSIATQASAAPPSEPWITAIGATTFTINFSAAFTGTVSWAAAVI